uniref:PDZ domain-containing protein n=1 Tax=Meloidogyne hapla TaxID=6305 RepID=A0A1I8BW08_MELHA
MSVRSSISEINVEVKRRSTDSRIEFVEGSRPPRVRKVGYNSYLNGYLYVGDEVISLNDEVIRTAEDFYRIVGARSREPVRLLIRVRRDCFYRITIKRVEGEQGKREVLDLEIKWRRGGMPLGVSMNDTRVSRSSGVTIGEIDAGSIADGNFHYGDIMTHVNGKRISDTKSARAAILEGINNNNSLTIRVERPAKLDDDSHLPADVTKIIKRQINFHRHAHKYSAAITSAEREATTSSILSRITGRGGNTSNRSSRRSSPEGPLILPV